jgi:ABC-type bacteriocin/lantibiotic exporter with double-glycine peptidase domain
VVNEAVAVFDGRTQDRIRDYILGSADGRGVIWIANRPSQAAPFERVIVMQGGRVVAYGKKAELEKNALYADLMASA